MMKKLFRNNLGFTLVEIAIVTGLIAMGSLFTVKVMDRHIDDKTRIETKSEEGELASQVKLILSASANCSETLKGKPVTTNLLGIKNSSGLIKIPLNTTFGPSKNITLTDLKTRSIVNPPAGGGDGLVFLDMEMTRNRVSSEERKVYKRSVLVKISTDSSNLIESCFTASSSNIAKKTEEGLCISTGGVYSAGVCSYPACDINSGKQLLTGKCLNEMKSGLNSLDSEYVNLDGDTINGVFELANGNKFEVDGTVQLGDFIEINGEKIDFSFDGCSGANRYPVIISKGKIKTCKSFVQCPPNKYYNGVDKSGNAKCEPVPFPLNKSCPNTDQYIEEILPDGTIRCGNNHIISANAPNGEYIQSLRKSGITYIADNYLKNSCKSDEFMIGADNGDMKCVLRSDKNVFGQICDPGMAIRGFDSSGKKKCEEICKSTCPLPENVCKGTTDTRDDGCGKSCNVVGTKDNGSCAKEEFESIKYDLIADGGLASYFHASRNGVTSWYNLDLKKLFPKKYGAGGYELTRAQILNGPGGGYPDKYNSKTQCLAHGLNFSLTKSKTKFYGKTGVEKEFYLDGELSYSAGRLRFRSGAARKWGDCGKRKCGGCLDHFTIKIGYKKK